MEAQKWGKYALTDVHLERFRNEKRAFQHRAVAIIETWARAFELDLKRQSNKWRHRDLAVHGNFTGTQSGEDYAD